MSRTLINISPEDKAWLDREAKHRHVPMTELVRQAVHDYRMRAEALSAKDMQSVLERTAGIWQAGDGLLHQSRLRREWNKG